MLQRNCLVTKTALMVYISDLHENNALPNFARQIVDLMIDNSERQNLKIEQLEHDNSELEQYRTKVNELWMDKMRMEHIQMNS